MTAVRQRLATGCRCYVAHLWKRRLRTGTSVEAA